MAVIQTLETLNIPEFLIGRWNIRVKFAYKGLLWVGGAQVDPGFRGRLCCPIYNLSTKAVKLKHGEELAMIDFVTTTPFRYGVTKPFQWWHADKKLLFEQYDTKLSSGVEHELKNIKDESSGAARDVKEIEKRIDTFMTLTFTVVAVLFAGLGIIATRTPEQLGFFNPTVWVSALAFFFALWAFVGVRRDARGKQDSWLPPAAIALLVAMVAVMFCQLFYAYQAHTFPQPKFNRP